jgi:hypothetical protein
MIPAESRVSRSPLIESVSLAESQYQTWSYFVEIAKVTQWLPMLNSMTRISLSL